MPVISRFYGITIKMYLRQKEHNPPHIHAIYGECIGMFSLEDGEMFEGDIPSKGQHMVKEIDKKAAHCHQWIEDCKKWLKLTKDI